MKRRYQLTVTLIEDAQFGSGTGAGDIDAFIERDIRGQPVIRASHIKGVLRETANGYRNLKRCEQAQIDSLFGKSANQRGGLIMTSLYVEPDSKTTDCPVWTSTARQPGSRLPQEDTLRVIEHCPAGLVFSGEIELMADDSCQTLLKTLVRRTDRLGGHRNRGNGLVQCRLETVSTQPSKLQGQPKGSQPRLRLVMKTLEPLLLPNSGHPGNLLATEGFIRGQILQGALVQQALAANQLEIVEQWLSGAVAIGDALPLPAQLSEDADFKSSTVMPIPLSLCTPKPGGQVMARPWWSQAEGVADFVLADNGKTYDGLATEKPEDQPKLKRPGARQFLYRSNANSAWQRYTPSIDVRMRVNLQNSEQGLFSHEEIAEKTLFISDLVFADAKSANHFAEVFDQQAWLRVGREGRPVSVVQAIWLDEPKTDTPRDTDTWRLTLTSDTILRDETLAFVTRPDIDSLLQAVGNPRDDYPNAAAWQIDTGYCEFTPIHGFNAVTGLRRVPAMALRRGSDFIIKGSGSGQLADELNARPAIGERIAEGYGRFIIDFEPFQGRVPPQAAVQTLIENPDETLLDYSQKLAGKLSKENSLPSRSQLGWLRGMAEGGEKPEVILKRIEKAMTKQGGKAWKNFPVPAISETFAKPFFANNEQRQRECLISLVRWLMPRVATQTEQAHSND